GEARGVRDGEGDVEEARERLREQGLSRARRPDEQDVALLQLDAVVRTARPALAGLAGVDALVVVVDRDREDLLGEVLPDHVLVEEGLDLRGRGQGHLGAPLVPLVLLRDDVVAQLDALVADVDGGPGDQLADLALRLPAEGAGQVPVVVLAVPAHMRLRKAPPCTSARRTSRIDSTTGEGPPNYARASGEPSSRDRRAARCRRP